jgi:hypothetical protein
VRGTLVWLPFEFVYSQIPTYQEANGKSEKMYVIGTILNNVLNSGGRFLKENESREWVELDRIHAREKVGNTLRACCTMLDVYKKLEWRNYELNFIKLLSCCNPVKIKARLHKSSKISWNGTIRYIILLLKGPRWSVLYQSFQSSLF